MNLYDVALSGHCHKVRLLLSVLALDHELIPVDLMGGENREPGFLALNPLGQVPVLDDDGFIVRDSNAILVYLAAKYDDGTWLPKDPEGRARVHEWLAVANKELYLGPCVARLVKLFGMELNYEAAVAQSEALLKMLEAYMMGRDWLAIERPTIADIACYSYTAHAPEGGISLEPYPNVRRWLARVEGLPGFVDMPKSPVGEG
jgi:glutathione S-transferase